MVKKYYPLKSLTLISYLNMINRMEGFNEEDFLTLFYKTPVVGAEHSVRPKAYSLLIGGKLFITSKGKTVWNQKNHVGTAFNNEMYRKAQDIARWKLQNNGVSRYEVYKYPEYKNAFAKFKKALIERGLYQIIEVQ